MWGQVERNCLSIFCHRQWPRRTNVIKLSRRNYFKDREAAKIAGLVVEGNAAEGRGLRNVIKTALASLATVIGVYTAIQIYQGKPTVFIPLWIDNNMLWRSKYRFPLDIKYFDEGYYNHLQRDMEIVAKVGRESGEVFEDENIKYKVLEELGRNRELR